MAIRYVQRSFSVTKTSGGSVAMTQESGTTNDHRVVTARTVMDDGAGAFAGGWGTVDYSGKSVSLKVVTFDRSATTYKADHENASEFSTVVADSSGSSSSGGNSAKGGSYGSTTVGEEVFAGSSIVATYRTGTGTPSSKSMSYTPAIVSIEPVVLFDASIESDDGGFCWALSATGPEHLMDQLAPVAGLPARVRVTVDGHAWVFAIERISRTRRFGQHRAAIQGRSLTALVGDPYFPAQDFASAADITAQQALIGALDLTGVGITWDVTDWLMPAGVWQYNGTPLAAALRLAESAGNVLRSHATDAQLIMAPGYTAMPWDWASATPAVNMPADIILTDSLEPDPSPEYNAVYVSGQQSGVLGHVVRTGTAGDLIAPPVTDPYITHAEAARMRGQRILGAAGRRMTQTITAPFLTDAWAPGPILPGYLVQVTDIGETWRGLVRGIRISASMTTVRQQITIERRTT